MSTSIALPTRTAPVATLKSWTPWPFPNSSLIGHCEVIFAGGWVVSAVPIFKRADGTLAAGVPSIPQLDRDGRIKTDANGKRVYTAVITFATTAARSRWNDAVTTALRDAGINTQQEQTRGDAP